MPIRFAAAIDGQAPRLSRAAARAALRRPANDNGIKLPSDERLHAALRHFGRHGLAAAGQFDFLNLVQLLHPALHLGGVAGARLEPLDELDLLGQHRLLALELRLLLLFGQRALLLVEFVIAGIARQRTAIDLDDFVDDAIHELDDFSLLGTCPTPKADYDRVLGSALFGPRTPEKSAAPTPAAQRSERELLTVREAQAAVDAATFARAEALAQIGRAHV